MPAPPAPWLREEAAPPLKRQGRLRPDSYIPTTPLPHRNRSPPHSLLGDVSASKSLHDSAIGSVATNATEVHGGWGSDYVKSIVFGGLDGIITTFSTIAAVVGGDMQIQTVIVLGFANLIVRFGGAPPLSSRVQHTLTPAPPPHPTPQGDGISMGAGDYISSKAEYNYQMAEKAREEWEYDNYPAGEAEEMVEILQGKGLDEADARTIIGVLSRPEHRDFFVEYMMHEELGLEIPDDPWGPAKDGAVTFVSFLVFGSVPMWIYVFCWAGKYDDTYGVFGIAAAASVVTLFVLGMLQGAITKRSLLFSGMVMAIVGSLASGAAFGTSYGILKILGSKGLPEACA